MNLITIDSSLSKPYSTVQGSWLEDPFFGAAMEFTLENSIVTPIFGRGSEQIYTQFELEDIRLDFEVFDLDYTAGYTWDNPLIEGSSSYYDVDIVDYANDRFKNTAIDDLQIPLISPMELDFGEFDPSEYSDINLELLLDLDIALANRLDSDKEWSLRSRLLYYDFLNQEWQDFSSAIYMNNYGGNYKNVWNPGLESNPLKYLQSPNQYGEFVYIKDSNNLGILNSLLIENLNDDFIEDGKMKLAFISYILPGNWEDDPALSKNIFYERENTAVPISV